MPRWYLIPILTWISIWHPTAADENEGVEIGLGTLSPPCAQQGGDRVEFLVAARNMVEVSQVSIIFRWAPLDAVVDVTSQIDPALAGRFLDFPPLVGEHSAKYGMGSLSSSIDGEAILARFSFQLAPHITPDTPVDIWIDLVSLGPEFTRHDTIHPLTAQIPTNYCDADQQVLTQALFVQPEQSQTQFSATGHGRLIDGSAGEVLLTARFFRQGIFPADQLVVWTILNESTVALNALTATGPIEVSPNGTLEGDSRSDKRGRALLLLDAEADASGAAARAAVTACTQTDTGELCTSSRVAWTMQQTSIATVRTAPLPTKTDLQPSYPNPFNAAATIPFTLAAAHYLQLDILDMMGQRVTNLVTGSFSAGNYEYFWDGRNDAGQQVASGIYFYRMRLENTLLTRSMLLLR